MKNLFSLCVLILASTLILTGCQSLLPKGATPAKIFTLNAPRKFASRNNAMMQQLPSIKIILPQAAPGLDTERVALRNGNNQIEYYRDIRWADNVPALLQSLLVESFDNSHSFKSVSNDLVDINSDYHILTDIRDFQIEYQNNKPYANIRLVIKLVKNASQSIVMTRTYHVKTFASSTGLDNIMTAFDTAYQEVAHKIVLDMIAEIQTKRK